MGANPALDYSIIDFSLGYEPFIKISSTRVTGSLDFKELEVIHIQTTIKNKNLGPIRLSEKISSEF